MEIDKNLKNDLLSLSDDSLKNVVKSVAMAAGINKSKLNITKDDILKIRDAITNATDKDAQEALKIIGGDEKARQIINQVKNGNRN